MKTFSFIHTSDWHIWDKHKYSINDSRLKQIIKNTKIIIKTAYEKKVGIVFVAGDIFEIANPYEKLFKVFVQLLNYAKKYNVKMRFISGDHDTDGINYSFESFSNIIKNYDDDFIKLFGHKDNNVKQNIEYFEPNIKIYYLPFQENIKEQIKIYTKGLNKKYFNILISHFGIDMAKASSGKRIANQITADMLYEWDYVGVGDYHTYQKVGTKGNIFYSGSIIRVNRGERNDVKGFNYVVVKNNKVKIEKIILNDIEFIEANIKYDNIDKYENKIIKKFKNQSVKNSIVRITVRNVKGFGEKIPIIQNAFYLGGAKEVKIVYVDTVNDIIVDKENKYDNIDLTEICRNVIAKENKDESYFNYINDKIKRYV